MSIPRLRACAGEKSRTYSPSQMSVPLVGLIAPATIFISVDFPAPLSPATPTTSPWWITKSASASACTGPYDLCSARASISGVSAALLMSRAPLRGGVHRDGRDENPADRYVLVVGVDVHQAEAVEDAPEDQRAQQGAEDAPSAAEQARAAHDGGADRVQRDEVADIGRGGIETRGLQ